MVTRNSNSTCTFLAKINSVKENFFMSSFTLFHLFLILSLIRKSRLKNPVPNLRSR